MKFTLVNLLMVNATVALGLGILLGDETKIKQNEIRRRDDLAFIKASRAWRSLPASSERFRELDADPYLNRN